MISFDKTSKTWKSRVSVCNCLSCLNGQLEACERVQGDDNEVYRFNSELSGNPLQTLPTIEEEPEEPDSEENINFQFEYRDAVTVSDENSEYSEYICAREQEAARHSPYYEWMKSGQLYSRQIINTYLNLLNQRVPADIMLMDMNGFKYCFEASELTAETFSSYFDESIAQKRLLIIPIESQNGVIEVAEASFNPDNHVSLLIINIPAKKIQLADSDACLYTRKNRRNFLEFGNKIVNHLQLEPFQFDVLNVAQQNNDTDCSSLMLFNATLATMDESLEKIQEISTDDLRISQILALDDNCIRKNWTVIATPSKTFHPSSTPRHAKTPPKRINKNESSKRRLFDDQPPPVNVPSTSRSTSSMTNVSPESSATPSRKPESKKRLRDSSLSQEHPTR